MTKPVRVLYIYAEAYAPLRRALEEQLAVFRRQGQIEEWGADWLLAGAAIEPEVARHLSDADVLVPLVTPSLFASDRDYHLLQQALLRHDDQGTPLIPVIARPVAWQVSPLGGAIEECPQLDQRNQVAEFARLVRLSNAPIDGVQVPAPVLLPVRLASGRLRSVASYLRPPSTPRFDGFCQRRRRLAMQHAAGSDILEGNHAGSTLRLDRAVCGGASAPASRS